ncbi:MAG: formylglycine-generating enzyme family protein [Deltaproteobacteria bacterium]|nr:formylglycine-generating enzyme family protein [Deltaproteobacteria bacterium]
MFMALVAVSVMIVPAPWVTASDGQDLRAEAGGDEEEDLGANTTKKTSPTGRVIFTNSWEMQFVLIPAGSFMMGSDSGNSDEQPVHQVQITNPFYLGIYEVTMSEWQDISVGRHLWLPRAAEQEYKRPMFNATWETAQRFIRDLNMLEGTDKYRLPTEAEWEYACRAGSTTAYYFGDDQDQLHLYAWYQSRDTQQVGRKRPNAWGLYDMHGNVQEWCADWYGADYYSESSASDPQGPDEPDPVYYYYGNKYRRVLRGGSVESPYRDCRSASRDKRDWGVHESTIGFRVAMDP